MGYRLTSANAFKASGPQKWELAWVVRYFRLDVEAAAGSSTRAGNGPLRDPESSEVDRVGQCIAV